MAKRRATCPLEEEDKTAKMSQISVTSPDHATEAIIQEGPLFDPVNFTSLIQIVNQLDPSSFVKFARTCKDLHAFCFSANGIRVRFPCSLSARRDAHEIERIGPNIAIGLPISERNLQKLQKMPFSFVIKDLHFRNANARVLEEVRQMLIGFPRVAVEFVTITDWAEDWNDIIQFLQEYKVKRVLILLRDSRNVIPVDLLPFFFTELDYFLYPENVADDVILSATAKELRLPNATISKYTFVDLLQKFVKGDIVNWTIGREPLDAGAVDSDPFIKVCSEAMKAVKMEEIDWKNMEPSVLYNRPSEPRNFRLRNSDGSFGFLDITENWVNFSTGIQY